MKKLLVGLFIFSFLFIGSQVSATDEGCSNGVIFSSTTGQKCPVVPPICPPNNPGPKLCSDGSFSTVEPETKDANGCITSYKFICPVIDTGCSNNQFYSSTTGKACKEFVAIDDGCKGSVYSSITGKECPASTLTTEAGCLNNEIYSVTTGQVCPVDQGCNGTNFSTTTGKACPSVTIIDKGCTGANYSLTTGQRCPISTITTNEGCNGTNNYSLVTGQACPIINNPVILIKEVTDTGCNGANKYSIKTGQVCVNYSEQNIGSNNNLPNTTTPIRRTLKLGVRGEDVKTLQAFLNLLADGSFGPKTKAKVMEWQRSNGLISDGIFGVISNQKANLAE